MLRRLFSYNVLFGAAVAFVSIVTVGSRLNDPDLWFHLKLGEIIWNTRAIPTSDTFSYTAYGHAWTAHEWLAQVSIYAAYRLGGYSGLMLWLALLSSLLFVGVFVLSRRRAGAALAAFVGAMTALFFASVGMSIRPQMIGLTMLTAEMLVLEAAARDRRWLVLLPPLFAVWVNCHGSYWFGLAVLFVYWVCSRAGVIDGLKSEREPRALGVVLLLCAAALCCNPVGIRLLLYPFNVALQQTTSMIGIEEWLPPDLGSARGLAMVALPGALLLAIILGRAHLTLRELLLMGMALLLAMRHVRMLFVFGIVIGPIVARVLAPAFGPDSRKEHPVLNAILLAAFAVMIARIFPTPAELRDQVQRTSPVAAVEFIRHAGVAGPMLNEYGFGGYLIWSLPEQKVFVDGRGDVFDWTGVLAEYGRWATLSEDPRVLLDKHGVRLCLLSKRAPLARVIPYLQGWRTAYSDEVATVFVR
jgi:hypothetical protein